MLSRAKAVLCASRKVRSRTATVRPTAPSAVAPWSKDDSTDSATPRRSLLSWGGEVGRDHDLAMARAGRMEDTVKESEPGKAPCSGRFVRLNTSHRCRQLA